MGIDTVDIDGVSFLKCNKRTCIWNGGYSASGGEDVRLCGFGACDCLKRYGHDGSMYSSPNGCIHQQEVKKLADDEIEILEAMQNEQRGRGLEGYYAEKEVIYKRWNVRAVRFRYYKPEMRRRYRLRFTLWVLSCCAALGLALYEYLFQGRHPAWWLFFVVAIICLGVYARSDWRKARWMAKRREYELTWEKVLEETKVSGKSELLEHKADLLVDSSIQDPGTLEYI